MDNKRLRNILIGMSLFLVVAFLVGQNYDRIFSGNLFGKKPSGQKSILDEDKNPNDKIDDEEIKYGVNSANPIASEVGMKVLQDGGNAVDAAVAVSFALNITDPQNSGIGGGGGMLIKDGVTGEEVFYDYYISSGDKEPVQDIGIPGFLRGMEVVNEEMGTKELSDLIQYAIDLGEEGIEVTEGYERILNVYNYISQVHPSFSKNGRGLVAGDILYQPELIETLKEVRDKGPDIFYKGEHEISKNFLDMTGISKESLDSYEVYKSQPLEIEYEGYKVIAPPAPFTGLTLLQNLLIESEINLPEHDFSNIEYNNTMQDILILTGKEGRETLGDPEFTEIDYEEKLDVDYLIGKYREDIEDDEDYEETESVSTTAFSVIDKDGTIVSGTNTLSNYWGSYMIRDGIIYNNAMKNFTSGKNKFEYNKRPKTGITPVIITKGDSYKEALGTNGGAKIPTYLFRTIVNTKKYKMDIQLANDLERIYYFKKQMHFETEPPYSESSQELINFEGPYRELNSSDAWGIMNGILIEEDGQIKGHTDKRNYFQGGSIYYDGSEIVYD